MKKLPIKQAKNFLFLSGTQASWEAGFEGAEIPEKPGYRKIEFQDGDFHLVQEYSVFGVLLPQFISTRVISFHGTPVWKMMSSGRYDKNTAAFLQRALMKSYINGFFLGGRGPGHFVTADYPEYAYENVPFLNRFGNFIGHDKVHFRIGNHNGDGRTVSEIFSFCNYRGGLLPVK